MARDISFLAQMKRVSKERKRTVPPRMLSPNWASLGKKRKPEKPKAAAIAKKFKVAPEECSKKTEY